MKKNRIKDSISYRVFSVVNGCFLTLLALLCVIPFVHILAVSFSDAASTAANSVGLLPVGFHLDAFQTVLTDVTVYRAFGITLLRMVLGTAWSMLLTISAAYPLSFSKKDFFGRQFFVVIFFVSMLFSGGIIPYYILIKDLGLVNTIGALVLGGVPVGNMIILMNFFRMLPSAVLESAFLDGASHFQVLIKIYLPMSKPSIATLSLLCLVGHWNDWFSGLIYMKDMDMYPLQTYIYNALQKTGTYTDAVTGITGAPRQAINAALIVLSIIPVIVVFPLLQRHIKDGMVLGAVKE